jgi:GNAT superfamily N-acetyltransferase
MPMPPPPSDIHIRACRSGDWPRVRAIHAAASRDEGAAPNVSALLLPLPDAEGDEDLTPGVFVAELGPTGEIAGFVAVDGDEITMLAVDPALQRRGVGRALLRCAIRMCGPEARLEVLAGNGAAVVLYEAEGFAVVDGGEDGGIAWLRMRRCATDAEDDRSHPGGGGRRGVS